MLGHRHHVLLVALRRASHPVSGDALAAQLEVSTRSVRQYVREINREAKAVVVAASHRGYELDVAAYDRFMSERPNRATSTRTPQERIYAIVSSLLRQADGSDVHSLADALHVSPATIESDLARVREVLAEFDLKLHRDWGVLRIDGPESQRRRVVRQIVVDSAREDYPAFMGEVFACFQSQDVRLIRLAISDALGSQGLTVNEYALNDLVLHLMIAVDRFRSGHRLSSAEAQSVDAQPTLAEAASELAGFLERTFEVRLTPAECAYLEELLEVKTVPYESRALSDPAVRDSYYFDLVRDILSGLSEQYLIDLDDDAFVLNLSMHVRSLVARAESGRTAHNPVAALFKSKHPLIHELAVYVAHQIELRQDVSVGADEIAFLAFHIGSQLLRSPNNLNRVTITCVTPRFHQIHALMREQLASALPADVLITDVVTSLDADWSAVSSDLIVSSVLLPGTDLPPIVLVSPLLNQGDLDEVAAAVRRVREHKVRLRLRTNVVELLDPLFFHHVPSVESREAALTLMTDKLVAEGVVHDDYLGDVLEREQISPTAFGALAVPHSLYLDANRTTISVLISDTPIAWGDSRVRLVALFVLAPNGRAVFRTVLDEFVKVLSKPANVDRLTANVATYEDLLATVFGALDR